MRKVTALRIARVRSGLQVRELASRIGVQPSRLSRLECGREEPTSDEVVAIRKALLEAPNPTPLPANGAWSASSGLKLPG